MVSDPPGATPGPSPLESAPPSGGLVFEGTTQITGPVIGGNVQNLYLGDDRDRRQRLRLADLVDNFWISRVLGPAGAATQARIPLAKRVQPAVADGNRLMVPRTTEQPADSVPESTPILDIFTRLGSLLILGAPGAGKTTTLYDLARAAVNRARQDAGQPVPIVVNLTSWALRRQPMATWLVSELAEQYKLPRELTTAWLQQGALLPLLDGLDEVPEDRRDDCVAALNAFPFGLSGMVVCCRIATYDALPTRLTLGGSVTLEPLTLAQMDAFVGADDSRLGSLRAALQTDPQLRELASTPLMLNTLCTVYTASSSPPVAPAPGQSSDAWRAELVAESVDILLNRAKPAPDPAYTPACTRFWLRWLAQRLVQEGRATFLIENLQPSWLPAALDRWVYLLGSRFAATLVFGLLLLLIDLPGHILSDTPVQSIVVIGTSTLVTGIVAGLVGGVLGRGGSANSAAGAGGAVWRRLITGVLIGGAVFGAVGLATVPATLATSTFSIAAGVVAGLLHGLIFGFFATLVFGWDRARPCLRADIQPVQAFDWSWASAGRGLGLAGLGCGVPFVLVCLFVGGAFLAVQDALLAGGLVLLGAVGASAVLPVLLAGLLLGGLRSTAVVRQVRPNQGIWESAENAGKIMLFFGLGITGAVMLAVGLFELVVFGALNTPAEFADPLLANLTHWDRVVLMGVAITFILVIFGGLTRGGFAVIQHFVLRGLLARRGLIPWRYAQFLDYGADLGLLQPVGPGYQFTHALIRQELAQGDPQGGGKVV